MTAADLLARYAAGERDFRNANLPETDLAGATLSYANLSHANLSGATLFGATLSGVTLTLGNRRVVVS